MLKHILAAVIVSSYAASNIARAGNDQSGTYTGATPVHADAVLEVPESTGAVDGTQKRPKVADRAIEEIIVTAQKREENLQDVPISIQAFSADNLDARGVRDQSDLPKITPGLDVGSQVGYTTIYLRGVGSDAYITADPSVASYIDGIYYPFAQGLAQDFGAVERVEVLKGPQGTLFGRNALGGAIHVITRSPELDRPEVSAQASYANYDNLQTRVYASVPLGSTVALSASGIYNDSDYYYNGIAAGKPLRKETAQGIRLKARWKPTDDLDVIVTGFKLITHGSGSLFQLNQDPSLIGAALGIKPQAGYSGSVDTPAHNDLNNGVVYGQITYKTPWVDLKALGSDQLTKTFGEYDFDGSAVPLVSFNAKPTRAAVKTGEFQIISNDKSFGSKWLKFIGGAYYFESVQGFKPATLNVANIDLEAGTIAGVKVPAGFINLLDALGSAIAVPSGGIDLTGLIGTNSLAGFGQATVSFTDWLDLTLGARYQTEKRKLVQSSVGLETPNGPETVLVYHSARDAQTGATVPTSHTTNSFKPKVSLDLRPFGDDYLLYVSYQQAIKSATYNALAIYEKPAYVKPEELTAYEIGLKSKLFGGLVKFNIAAYQYKSKDIQVQFVSLLQGGAVSFENAGAARIRGADFDSTIQLLPNLVEGFSLTAGAAYLSAIYTSYPKGTGYDAAGVYSTNNDYTGNRVVRTPKVTATASLSKTWDVYGGGLELAADGYYNSGFFYAASNLPRTEQKAYEVVGAHVSYLYEPWNTRVTVFGKNILDKKYTAGELPTDFGDLVTLAPPVMYGARVNFDFK